MAEAPLPIAPSSSPSSSSVTGRRSSPPHSGLAFLVHSPETVSNNLPPDVDNKPLARQKRRRTSKEDEEILKAEYQKNPKPDKAARIEIVSKVALSEKEVQIWFQNKRQNDRRRSRPRDGPSAALMSSSSNMSDPATEDEHPAQECDQEVREKDETRIDGAELAETSNDAIPASAASPPTSTGTDSQDAADSMVIPSTNPPHTADTAPTELSSSQQALLSSQDTYQARTSYLANRRSASFVRYNEENPSDSAPFPLSSLPTTESVSSTRSLTRAHSFVRLSMTADGKARVVTDADQSPSPPKLKADPATYSRAAASLRRSYSAAGLNERLQAAAAEERSPKIARTSSNIGRSRDSRAWEFWCDPDTRNNRSLTTQAEQEGSGSAVDAIGLLRANRRILAQNQARQNQNAHVVSRYETSTALGEQGAKKSSHTLQRASTTHGRLQTKDIENYKNGDSSDTEDLPQTESDKENWEPEVPQSQSCRARPCQTSRSAQRPRRILGENTEIMSQSSSLGAMLAREKAKDGVKWERENSDPEQDEELRSFMNGGDLSSQANLSSAEEAGCVEGLLKLSRGNWR
ncbi:hypothetical protein CC78DRAFT_534505 [Lojkania enalia]|uniref:Homeobox domain-containing protein n=1 Tax=Lojkania enalia TaxID=147567 RepID=A0A9P4K7S6_9PLEO|nr:hypothetical protein CC78DRAFT_534505 [Didymosphaeria enalia]